MLSMAKVVLSIFRPFDSAFPNSLFVVIALLLLAAAIIAFTNVELKTWSWTPFDLHLLFLLTMVFSAIVSVFYKARRVANAGSVGHSSSAPVAAVTHSIFEQAFCHWRRICRLRSLRLHFQRLSFQLSLSDRAF